MNLQFLSRQPFDDPAGSDDLLRIMLSVADGWHVWDWPDPSEWEDSQYFQRERNHFELAIKSFTASGGYPNNLGGRPVYILNDQEAPAPNVQRLPVHDAAIFLSVPLSILVENQINDGTILWWMLKAIDSDLAESFLWPRPPIMWMNGGGKQELARLLIALHRHGVDAGIPARLMAIVDSDAKFPGHIDAPTADLIQACEQAGVTVHVLHKRAIENYMSDRVLGEYGKQFPDVQVRAAFLTSLTRRQRDHFPIKNGLSDSLSASEAELYAGVDLDAATPIKLCRLIDFVMATQTFPTWDDIIERDSAAEMTQLAETIRRCS